MRSKKTKHLTTGNNISIPKRLTSIFTAMLLLLGMNWQTIHAIAEAAFTGYNQNLISMDPANWMAAGATVGGSGIAMQSDVDGSTGIAITHINLGSISSDVDLDMLEISFTADALIANEDPLELDASTIDIYFSTTDSSSDAISTVNLSRGFDSPGSAITLMSHAGIPAGTRYIVLYFNGEQAGATNTVTYSNISLSINDSTAPELSASYDSSWTNQGFNVSITAEENDSGLEGIYDADSYELLSTASPLVIHADGNQTTNYFARDNASNTSGVFTLNITNIDTNAPGSPPDILLSTFGWSTSPVTFALSDTTPAAGESPEVRQYRLNGGEWTNYTSEVTISTEGQTSVEARVYDEAGNASGVNTATASVDTIAPAFDTLSFVSHPEGGATVTAAASDAVSGLSETRWASGSQSASYFASAGTAFTDSFTVASGGTYTVYAVDVAGNAEVDTITINTYPSINAISSQSLEEDESRDIVFSVSDSETDNGSLTVQAVSSNPAILPNPVCVNSNGTVTLSLAPAANQWGGPVTVTVTVTDENLLQNSASFDVTVSSLNDGPVATDDNGITVDEDANISIDVLANDSDVDGNDITIHDTDNASKGVVAIAPDKKSLTYTPNADQNGADSFTYTITDGNGLYDTATVSITINEINDLPEANDDSVTITEDETPLIDVLANDVDKDLSTTADESLTILPLGPAAFGTVAIEGGQIRYTPPANWSGTDTFSYTIEDRTGAQSTAAVTVVVQSFNDPPVITGVLESYTILQETPEYVVSFQISDVEVPNVSLMLQASSSNTALLPNWAVTVEGLGDADPTASVRLAADPDEYGSTVITLKLSDGFQITQQTFTLYVEAINHAPQAHSDTLYYTEDASLLIDMDNLVANDTDADGDTLHFSSVVSLPASGTLVEEDALENIWRYTPPADFTSAASFVYEVTDGELSDTGTVSLVCSSQNDAPTLTLDPGNVYACDEDTLSGSLLFAISDVETSPESLVVAVGSSNEDIVSSDDITVSQGADGNCSFTILPNSDQHGVVSITIVVSDGAIFTSESFNFTINSVEDLPSAVNDQLFVPEGGSGSLNPLDNDRDADGDTLNVTAYTQGANGTVTKSGNVLTYRADSGFSGADFFTYTISDGDDTAQATVNVTVGSFSDPPQLTAIQNQYILEDGQTGAIAFSVSDPDADDTVTVTAVSLDEMLLPNNPDNIVLTDNEDGTYSINLIPAANAYGKTDVTITARDLAGNEDAEVFSITVYPVNDNPVAADDTVLTNEDVNLQIDVLANDSDIETLHADLKVINLTQPSHGRIAGANGVYTYYPDDHYHGPDSFTYTLSDGTVGVTATVNITVNAVNDAPVAWSNWQEMPNVDGESRTINVLGNDYDVDSDTLYVHEIVTPSLYGNVTVEPDGRITYTRNQIAPGGNGWDSFVYRVRDRLGETDPDALFSNATVYIGVDFGSSISAHNVNVSANEDAPAFYINLSVGNPAGNPLSITTTAPTLGTITEIDNVNKRVLYEPILNKNGSETITYTVKDTVTSQEVSASIYINIMPVNDEPYFISYPSEITMDEDTASGVIEITFDDVDEEHTIAGLYFDANPVNTDESKPAISHAGITVTRTETGVTVSIASLEDANGTGHIDFSVSDGMSITTQSVPFTVNPVNDAPYAPDIHVTLYEDTSKTINLININSDVDEDAVNASIEAGDEPAHGSAGISGDDVVYTPDHDYFGSDSFVYTLSDGHGGISTGTVYLTILNINDPPVISNLAYYHTTLEDTPVNVLCQVTDVDGDALDITFSSGNETLLPVANISSSLAGNDATITLDPALHEFGIAVVTMNVSDGTETTSQDFQVTIKSVNDLPVAQDDSYTISEDAATIFSPLVNDSDVEDVLLEIVELGTPVNGGSVANNSNGTITYTPAANYYGTDSFTYTVSDDYGGQDTATITVTITSVNDRPNAQNDFATTSEDVPVTIDLLGNDSDAEGHALTILSFSAGTYTGTVEDKGDGTVTYTPKENANGTDVFTYTVTDSQPENATATASVTVVITATNDPPDAAKNAAYDYEWLFNEDTTGEFGFDVWDVETEAKLLLVTITSSQQWLIPDTSIDFYGTGSQKMIRLTPRPNQFGSCVLSVTVDDGVSETTRDFDVTVLAVNDRPTITESAKTIDEDTIINDAVAGADVETAAASLTYSYDNSMPGPVNGTLTVNADGSWSYTPDADFNGSDVFSIKVDDGSGAANATNSVDVSITINAVNDNPAADDETASTNEDTPVSIDVLTGDTDVDMDGLLNKDPGYNPATEVLSIAADGFSGLVHGTAIVDGGQVLYTPEADWYGTEEFAVTINDAFGGSAASTVTVTVNPVNDSPQVAINTGMTLDEGATDTITNAMLNEGDVDDNGAGVIYTINGEVVNGQLYKDGVPIGASAQFTQADIDSGMITYRHDGTETTSDSFDFTMSDGGEDSSIPVSGTFNITVNPVNDAPVISLIDDQTINEDSNTGAISFTVTDVDNDDALLSVAYESGNELLVNDTCIAIEDGDGTNRTVTVTPILNKNGSATITLTVSDGSLTDAETFTVNVTPVKDDPAAQNDALTLNENAPATIIDIAANDDVDFVMEGDTLAVMTVDSHVPAIGTVEIIQDPDDGNRDKIRFTPDPNWTNAVSQDVLIGYTMHDDQEKSSSAVLTITIEPVNDSPVIMPISDQTIDEDTSTAALAFSVDDEEDAAGALTVTAGSSDTDLVPVENIVVTNHGSGSYDVVVTPVPNGNGAVDITLYVYDSEGAESQTSFTLTVTPVNDDPSDGDDNRMVVEDTPTLLDDLLDNDDVDAGTNPDIEDLNIIAVTQPANGATVISPDNKAVTYTPNLNYHDEDGVSDTDYNDDLFAYTTRDSLGVEVAFNVHIEVSPVNDAPVITSTIGTQTVPEGTSTGVLSFSVSDVDDDASTLVVTGRSSKTLLIPNFNITIESGTGGERTVQVTPNAKWNGEAVITLTVRDDEGLWDAGSVATFSVVVQSVNEAPVANDDTIHIDEDESANISVLSNDTDGDLLTNPDTESLRIVSVDGADPAHGTVTVTSLDTVISFVPTPDWNGQESFTYTIEDAGGLQSTATVSITVAPVNDAPAADDDVASTNEDTMVSIPVLEGDADIDLDVSLNETSGYDYAAQVLSIKPDGFSGVEHGTVAINGSNIEFTPALDWYGEETFAYTVMDSFGGEDTGNVTVTVVSVNDAPAVGANTGMTVSEGAEKTITNAMLNEDDPDDSGEGLTYQITADVSNGTLFLYGVEIHAANTFTQANMNLGYISYRHNGGETTSDAFSFTLTDGDEDGAGDVSGTFHITVTPVNDPPQLVNNAAITLNEGAAATIASGSLQYSDVDNTDVELIYTLTSDVASGSLKLDGADLALGGTFTQDDVNSDRLTYTHDGGETATDSFDFTLTDGIAGPLAGTFNFVIMPVNDTPVVGVNTGMTLNEGEIRAISSTMLNEADPDDSEEGLIYQITSDVVNGTLYLDGVEIHTSNTFTQADINLGYISYRHNGGETTSDAFSFTLTDGDEDGAGDATGTFNITVVPVNDPPYEVQNAPITLNEGVSCIVGTSQLQYSDVDNTVTELVYTLTSDTANGSLKLSGLDLAFGGTFTQDDVDNDRLTYTHDDGETATDSFGFTLTDGIAGALAGTFNFIISPVNDAPAVGVNTGMTVQEGALKTITSAMLSEADPDDDNDGVVYQITSDVINGTLRLNSTGIGLGDTFTQNDIASGNLSYQHDGSETTADAFSFTLTDGDEDGVGDASDTFNIIITEFNNPPSLVKNDPLTLPEGSSDAIDSTYLISTDTDNADAELIYTLKTNVVNGALELNGTALAVNDAFTQQDIADELLTYAHDGSETTADTFNFSLTDGTNDPVDAAFNIVLISVNDAPVIGVNTGMTLQEGASKLITDSMLNEADPDDDGAALTYRITADVSNGTLYLDGNEIGSSNAFTQSDIDAGLLSYTHNGAETTADSFDFNLTDGGEDGAGADPGTFAITVTPVNDAPETPVVLTPTTSDYFKDSETIQVTWTEPTDAEGDALTYTLEFYDGASWSTLTSGIAALSWDHNLVGTMLHTDQARYRVTAHDSLDSSAPGTGSSFIIDNHAPVNTVISVKSTDGQLVSDGQWTNGVKISLTGGYDLLDIFYQVVVDAAAPVVLAPGQVLAVESEGDHTVEIATYDALLNSAAVGTITFRIDRQAPLVPDVSLSSSSATNSGVDVRFALKADPGGSGNHMLTLPNGSKLPAQEAMTWKASANGTYAFVLSDVAGNKTSFNVKITAIDTTLPKITCEHPGYVLGQWSNKAVEAKLNYIDGDSGVSVKSYNISSTSVTEGGWLDYTKTVMFETDGIFYLHGFAKDRAGNKAQELFGPFMIDTKAPVLTVTADDSNAAGAGEPFIIKCNDDLSGVFGITGPAGSLSLLAEQIWIPERAGEYTFTATDKAGNTVSVSIRVPEPNAQEDAAQDQPVINPDGGGDTTPPTVDETQIQFDTGSSTATVLIKTSDLGTGVDKIQLPDGQWINADEITLENVPYGYITIKVMDKAGNVTEHTIYVGPDAAALEKDTIPWWVFGLAGFGLLLIILLYAYNVRVEIEGKLPDGTYRKRIYRKLLSRSREDLLYVRIKKTSRIIIETGEIRISRGLTKHLRDGYIDLEIAGKVYLIHVPQDAKDRYTHEFASADKN